MKLITKELDYADFIAITYECGVELPLYVNHFGTANMQKWLDEEREELLDNIQEEIVNDGETDDTGHTMTMAQIVTWVRM